jgi:SpoVK/Ycf46/Vps4 family AAA+-type ATPase
MPKQTHPRPIPFDVQATVDEVRARTDAARRPLVVLAGADRGSRKLAAEAIASEVGLAPYDVDLAAVVNKYLGETEKNLRRLFDAADGEGVLLFFEEAEALFGDRTDIRDSHDRYANLETDFLLECIESFPGLVVLSSNRKEDLDAAFLRRLRHIVHVPLLPRPRKESPPEPVSG